MTGTFPFNARNLQSLLNSIRRGQFVIPKTMSQSCASLIKKMLTVNPEKRISAAQALEEPWIKNHGDDFNLDDMEQPEM